MNEEQVPASNQWSEDNSAIFLKKSELFVPARAEQMASLLSLIPATKNEGFTIVELAAGGGLLARRILEQFPRCHYIALDGSPLMRQRLAVQLASFRERVEIRDFELSEQAWRADLPERVRCVVSSLCVHHLPAQGKQELFRDMVQRLEPGGAILLADVVRPANDRVANLYAEQYDEIVKAQSSDTYGDLSGYEQFQEAEWNYFRHDYFDPDSYDQPSLVSEQLLWLREAGLAEVDCFWLRAGHAIYGGYKAASEKEKGSSLEL